MSEASSAKDLTDSLSNLSLQSTHKPIQTFPSSNALTKSTKKKKKVIADNWNDELSSSSDTDATENPEIPSPPPPTPTSPETSSHHRNSSSVSSIAGPRSPLSPDSFARDGLEKTEKTERPATTDAVARRMISAALGVRAKSTKEQRDYDRAVREAEKKKKQEEREKKQVEEEEREKARIAIWEDDV